MSKENNGIALIVGGSTGMGLETAKRLVARDIPVHLVARASERLESAVKELEANGSSGGRTSSPLQINRATVSVE